MCVCACVLACVSVTGGINLCEYKGLFFMIICYSDETVTAATSFLHLVICSPSPTSPLAFVFEMKRQEMPGN